MPISDKHREAIEEYLINGHNKTKAYAKAYPDCKDPKQAGWRLFTYVYIKTEIDRRMAEIGAKTDWTYDLAKAKLMHTHDVAERLNQPSVMVSSIVSTNRMYGMDKDAGDRTSDTAIQLSKEALDALRTDAETVNRQSVAKPTLYERQEEG